MTMIYAPSDAMRLPGAAVRRRVPVEAPGLLRYAILLTGPDGEAWNISDRLTRGGIGRLTESTEEDFLELTHGDIDLTLRNDDGALDTFFAYSLIGSRYEVTIDRQRPSGRLLYDRIFGGVLDLPWSLTFDRGRRTAKLHVFSYSKMLESASAEPIRRANMDGRTGITAAGNATVTSVSSVTDIAEGDEITFYSETMTESQVIRNIPTASSLTCFENWVNTFPAGSTFRISTPYHRDRSVAYLAGLVFPQGGVTSIALAIEDALAEHPVVSPMAKAGFTHIALGTIQKSLQLLIRNGLIEARALDGPSLRLHTASAPDAIWTDAASGAGEVRPDWTPYYDTEPADIPNIGAIGSGSDSGRAVTLGAVIVNGDHVSEFDAAADDWRCRPATIAFGGFQLHLNNGSVGSFATVGAVAYGASDYSYCHHDRDPVSGKIWVSYTGKSADGFDAIKTWDGAVFATVNAAESGEVRYLRRLAQMAIHEREPGAGGAGALTTNLHLYDCATGLKVRTVTVPQFLIGWSLRVFDVDDRRYVAGLYAHQGTSRIRLWDAFDWSEAADWEVSTRAPESFATNAVNDCGRLTVYRNAVSGREFLVGLCGGEAFVLARYYAGVIPYADFDGMSCGAAMKEIALVVNSYLHVDHYKRGSLISRVRALNVTDATIHDLDEPLDQTSWPIWELYRTSAEVTGRDSAGLEFSVVSGTAGDSQHRLTLDSALVQDRNVARSVGEFYSQFLGRELREEEVVVRETGTPIHVFDFVRLAGRVYLAIEVSFDPERRRYTMRLVEVP